LNYNHSLHQYYPFFREWRTEKTKQGLGSLYGMQKKGKKAITEFLEALTLNPNIDAHASLGSLFLSTKKIR
jgi:hypothetical protein